MPVDCTLLESIFNQKKKQRLFNSPFPRYTPISPYTTTNYTQQQLNMRRKAEVLKYSNNASSSKTNNLTKQQVYAQIINGNIQKKSFSTISITVYSNNVYTNVDVKYPDLLVITQTTQTRINNGTVIANPDAVQIVGYTGYFIVNIIPNGADQNCSGDNLIPTPTSSSDVPGPITYLIDDETVPLYNYAYNRNVYGTGNDQTIEKWKYSYNNNIQLLSNSPQTIASLIITNIIDEPSYTFSIQIPFSIYITGTNLSDNFITNSSVLSNSLKGLAVQINNIILTTKYNDKDVELNNTPDIAIISNNQTYPVVNNVVSNFSPLLFDVSFVPLPTASINSYTASLYVGIINISNLFLYTTPGYVYDFNLEIDTQLKYRNNSQIATYNSAIQNTQIGSYVNVTTNNTIATNAIVSPLYSSVPNIIPLTIDGK